MIRIRILDSFASFPRTTLGTRQGPHQCPNEGDCTKRSDRRERRRVCPSSSRPPPCLAALNGKAAQGSEIMASRKSACSQRPSPSIRRIRFRHMQQHPTRHCEESPTKQSRLRQRPLTSGRNEIAASLGDSLLAMTDRVACLVDGHAAYVSGRRQWMPLGLEPT